MLHTTACRMAHWLKFYIMNHNFDKTVFSSFKLSLKSSLSSCFSFVALTHISWSCGNGFAVKAATECMMNLPIPFFKDNFLYFFHYKERGGKKQHQVHDFKLTKLKIHPSINHLLNWEWGDLQLIQLSLELGRVNPGEVSRLSQAFTSRFH